ncbi:hypothetical protein SprV_0602180700 [Sparganum proliferum]
MCSLRLTEMVQQANTLKPNPLMCGDGPPIAQARRGSVDSLFNSDVLQWQNYPCRGSVDYVKAMATEKRAAKPKNFIRENIRRLRERQTANTRRTSSVRGAHLGDTGQDFQTNARMHLLQQYIDSMPTKSEKSVLGNCGDRKTDGASVEHRDAGVETVVCEPQILTSSVRPLLASNPNEVTSTETQTTDQPTQPLESVVRSEQPACNKSLTGVSPLPLSTNHVVRAPTASRPKTTEPLRKSSTFLRAHEKTALLDDVLLSLSAVPIKPIPKEPRPEKLTVPRANSAREVRLIRRNVNFVRANANAMSYSPTRRAVSHESLVIARGCDNHSAVNRRLPLGKVPAYIVRRRREAEMAKQEQLSQTENAVPEGCRLMSEDERLDTLKLLQDAHAEVVEELGRLPIRMDTVRVRRRRSDLESKLAELESTINIFKKPRVRVTQVAASCLENPLGTTMPEARQQLIGVIDQGTSSSRFIVFSATTGEIVARHQLEIDREHPRSGWVQQSAKDIYSSTLRCINAVARDLRSLKISPKDVAAIGITNQRETSIAWDSTTGEPLCPAIVWSDSRTSDLVRKFISKTPSKDKNAFQKKTGLALHSYFSAMKIRWMIDNVPAVREALEDKRLRVGTVDSWVAYKLTGGASGGRHLTDVTNASRTLLFNINTLEWDEELCKFFKISRRILPKVISSAESYGTIKDPECSLKGVTLGGILGDQQAALVGQTWDPNPDPSCPRPHVKVTYGTGAFLLWDVGTAPVFSSQGILTTLAYKMGADATPHYALEGAVAYSGATMDWLRKSLELYSDHGKGDRLALRALQKTHGSLSTDDGQLAQTDTLDACYLVPAFSGLFCPYWREDARGVIAGFGEGCTRGDVIAAGYRSSAYQTQEVILAALEASGSDGDKRRPPRVISVDGGLTKSPVLMQSLADITGAKVVRPNKSEVMTALGAAVAAAISVGIDPTHLLSIRQHEPSDQEANTFTPRSSLGGQTAMVELFF